MGSLHHHSRTAPIQHAAPGAMWTACGATSSLAPPPHAAALQVHAGGHVGSVGEYVSVCHVHGMAVAVPHRAEKMLAVDPSRGQTSTIDLPVGIDASRSYKFSSAR